MTIKKPMLAGTLTDIEKVQYPVLCTPKLDGFRCLMVKGKALTRTFKPFPNNHIRAKLEEIAPDGFDGEIVVEGKNFSDIAHDVMREDGEPDFTFCVFDYYEPGEAYALRMERLAREPLRSGFRYVLPVLIKNKGELLAYEATCLSEGYEGVMLRDPNGPYKFGRSTENEGYLLKLKRFQDSEARILAIVEKMNNDNVAEKDAFGRTKRSSAMDGLTPAGTMGALKVKDLKTGIEFSIGSGFDDEFRADVWHAKKQFIGLIVKYKSQEIGKKVAPRFPVFLGMRDKRDM